MVLEAPLPRSKRPSMVVTAAVLDDRGHIVMQHLMEDHGLDEKTWHPGLVEHRMDPNQAILRKIRPQLQRTLPTLWLNALAPADPDIDLTAEMPRRQVIRDRSQIMMAPFGP